jgi:hypothetical protein
MAKMYINNLKLYNIYKHIILLNVIINNVKLF